MKYRIVIAENSEALSLLVSALIEEGWIPQGGVCINVFPAENDPAAPALLDDEVHLYQAMILK